MAGDTEKEINFWCVALFIINKNFDFVQNQSNFFTTLGYHSGGKIDVTQINFQQLLNYILEILDFESKQDFWNSVFEFLSIKYDDMNTKKNKFFRDVGDKYNDNIDTIYSKLKLKEEPSGGGGVGGVDDTDDNKKKLAYGSLYLYFNMFASTKLNNDLSKKDARYLILNYLYENNFAKSYLFLSKLLFWDKYKGGPKKDLKDGLKNYLENGDDRYFENVKKMLEKYFGSELENNNKIKIVLYKSVAETKPQGETQPQGEAETGGETEQEKINENKEKTLYNEMNKFFERKINYSFKSYLLTVTKLGLGVSVGSSVSLYSLYLLYGLIDDYNVKIM